jgi:hypothetical protein
MYPTITGILALIAFGGDGGTTHLIILYLVVLMDSEESMSTLFCWFRS